MKYSMSSRTPFEATTRMMQHQDCPRPIDSGMADTSTSGFLAECRRQSAVLKYDQAERQAADFIEAAGDWHE